MLPKVRDLNTAMVTDKRDSQRRERVQRVEGAGRHGGDLVVIQREQADRAQPCEAVIAHTAHPVAPQHPEREGSAFFSLARAGTRAEVAAGVRAERHDYIPAKGPPVQCPLCCLSHLTEETESSVCGAGWETKEGGWVGFTEARGVSQNRRMGEVGNDHGGSSGPTLLKQSSLEIFPRELLRIVSRWLLNTSR